MLFLKALILLLINLAIGWYFFLPLKLFIFYPKKTLFWGKKRIPFTPCYIRRKKRWLIDKLNQLLQEYLSQAANKEDQRTRFAAFEQKVYTRVWDALAFLEKPFWLPSFVKEKARYYTALLIWQLARTILREFIPQLIEKYQVGSYITLLDDKLDLDWLEKMFNRYVYRWLRYLSLALAVLSGLLNFLLFLLLA